MNNPGVKSVCSPICGDGKVLGSETCDDGNLNGTEGCNALCNGVANGYTCTGGTSTSASVCS